MQYEIRAMSIGEILDTSFRIVRNHFLLLLGIQLVVAFPAALAGKAVEDLATGPDLGNLLALLGVFTLFGLIVQPITSTATTYAIAQCYLGREVTFGAAMRMGASLYLPVMGTWLLVSLVLLAGFVLFVIPGLYLMVAFLPVYPVMVIERTFGFRAMSRSREIMLGHMGRAIGALLVAAIVYYVVILGVTLLAGFIPLIGVLANAIATAVSAAFMTAVLNVLYFDIRCRKEAFDLEHLAQRVELGAAAAAGG